MQSPCQASVLAALKTRSHQNARVLVADKGALAVLPNIVLDGKKAANLGTVRLVLLAPLSRAEG